LTGESISSFFFFFFDNVYNENLMQFGLVIRDCHIVVMVKYKNNIYPDYLLLENNSKKSTNKNRDRQEGIEKREFKWKNPKNVSGDIEGLEEAATLFLLDNISYH